jgi:hypothetical protein
MVSLDSTCTCWNERRKNCPIQDDPETGLDSNTR